MLARTSWANTYGGSRGFRASRGVLRAAAKILRVAMRVASDKNQAFVDEHVLEAALTELGATS